MKTAKITINKTPEQPDGIEIEIVQPETDLQGRLLGFLLASAVREAKRNERIKYDLPDRFVVEHRTEGTFVISDLGKEQDYYQTPRPIAIVGIRSVGQKFDLIHAEISPQENPTA